MPIHNLSLPSHHPQPAPIYFLSLQINLHFQGLGKGGGAAGD
jgi:hypothetical protein